MPTTPLKYGESRMASHSTAGTYQYLDTLVNPIQPYPWSNLTLGLDLRECQADQEGTTDDGSYKKYSEPRTLPLLIH